MSPAGELGKLLVVFGGVIVLVGVFLLLGGKVPWIGRLPGDILIQKKNVLILFPLGTCLLLSVLLTLLFSLFGKK